MSRHQRPDVLRRRYLAVHVETQLPLLVPPKTVRRILLFAESVIQIGPMLILVNDAVSNSAFAM